MAKFAPLLKVDFIKTEKLFPVLITGQNGFQVTVIKNSTRDVPCLVPLVDGSVNSFQTIFSGFFAVTVSSLVCHQLQFLATIDALRPADASSDDSTDLVLSSSQVCKVLKMVRSTILASFPLVNDFYRNRGKVNDPLMIVDTPYEQVNEEGIVIHKVKPDILTLFTQEDHFLKLFKLVFVSIGFQSLKPMVTAIPAA